MYAKLIHPTKIIAADEHLLRFGGRIIVNPTPQDFKECGYYEVEGLESVPEPGCFFYTLENERIIPSPIGGAL